MTKPSLSDQAKMNAAFAFVIMLAGLPMWALACQLTWNWYAPVVYPGAPPATFIQALAALLLVRLVRVTSSSRMVADFNKKITEFDREDEYRTSLQHTTSAAIATPVVVITLNWALHFVVHS